MKKKNLLLIVGGVVVGLLLLASATLLVMGVSELSESERQLESLLMARKEFYNKKPFPCTANIKREKDNVTVMSNTLADVVLALKNEQVLPERKTPSGFSNNFSERRRKMIQLVKSANVAVGENFAFGFERYMTGSLPAPDDVGRLTQQLTIIENLVNVLSTNGVKEIKKIVREEFEETQVREGGVPAVSVARSARGSGAAAAPAAGQSFGPPSALKNVGLIQGDALYGVLHFGLEFKAKEANVLKVLDGLARHGMFVVVRSVQLESPGVDVVFPKLETEENEAGKAAAVITNKAVVARSPKLTPVTPASPDKVEAIKPEVRKRAKVLSREDLLVSGPAKAGLVEVRLELDVYQFKSE